jgi:hypothetical protein
VLANYRGEALAQLAARLKPVREQMEKEAKEAQEYAQALAVVKSREPKPAPQPEEPRVAVTFVVTGLMDPELKEQLRGGVVSITTAIAVLRGGIRVGDISDTKAKDFA